MTLNNDPRYEEDFLYTDWDGDTTAFRKMLEENKKKRKENNGRTENK